MSYINHSHSHKIIRYGADHKKSFLLSPSKPKPSPSLTKQFTELLVLQESKIGSKPFSIKNYLSPSGNYNILLYLLGRYSHNLTLALLEGITDNVDLTDNAQKTYYTLLFVPLEVIPLKKRKEIIKKTGGDLSLFYRYYQQYKYLHSILNQLPTTYITPLLQERAVYNSEYTSKLTNFYMLYHFPSFKRAVINYYKKRVNLKYNPYVDVSATVYYIKRTEELIQKAKKTINRIEREQIKGDIIQYFEQNILKKIHTTAKSYKALEPLKPTKSEYKDIDDLLLSLYNIIMPYVDVFNPSSDFSLIKTRHTQLYYVYSLYKQGIIPPEYLKLHILALSYYLTDDNNTDLVLKETEFAYDNRQEAYDLIIKEEFDTKYPYPFQTTKEGRKFLKLYNQFVLKGLNFNDIISVLNAQLKSDIILWILLKDEYNNFFLPPTEIKYVMDKTLKKMNTLIEQYLKEVQSNQHS